MVIIDPELESVYEEAMQILESNKDDLLKYCDTTSIKKAMYQLNKVKVNRRLNMSRRGCCKKIGRAHV